MLSLSEEWGRAMPVSFSKRFQPTANPPLALAVRRISSRINVFFIGLILGSFFHGGRTKFWTAPRILSHLRHQFDTISAGILDDGAASPARVFWFADNAGAALAKQIKRFIDGGNLKPEPHRRRGLDASAPRNIYSRWSHFRDLPSDVPAYPTPDPCGAEDD
jgi:hypothetical protein